MTGIYAPVEIIFDFIPRDERFFTIGGPDAKTAILVDLIDQYPRINSSSGVLLSLLSGASRPTIRAGEGRSWWIQMLDFEVTERVDITVAE